MKEEDKNDEVFLLYGKFLVNFEHVCHIMRTGILYLLFPKPTPEQTRKNEILLEALAADQVRVKFMALITEEYQTTSTVFKLTKTISTVYEKLIPIRNSFAHGTSFIGTSNLMKEAEDGLLLLRHPKLKKAGLDLNFKRYEINTLKLSIELFERLKYAVAVVSVSVINEATKKVYADGYSPDKHHEGLSAELISLEKKLDGLINK